MNGSWIKTPADLIRKNEGAGPMRGPNYLLYDDATGKEIVSGSTVIGNPTIGHGWNLQANGIPPDVDGLLTETGIETAEQLCEALFADFEEIDFLRRCALIDMAYTLGERLRQFHDMIVAVNARDWPEAKLQALDSEWAKEEAPDRAQFDAALLAGGSTP